VAEGPDELTVEQRKEARGGRLYVDVTRNAYGQTTVAGYAVRARPGAPVALPVPWQWVEDGSSAAQSFRLADLRTGRLPFDEDPWRGWRRHAVDLRTRLEETERLETTELSPSPRSVPRAPRSSGTTR
jgi:bifunctional non-homologous end joining protein LigD